MNRLFKKISILYYFVCGGVISKKLYEKKYLQTSYFAHPSSIGYRWAVYDYYDRKHTGKNRNVRWPVAPGVIVSHPENIIFSPEDLRIFRAEGVYFQGLDAKIYIGKGCWIARNVGLITCNHDIENPDKHQSGKDIRIGDGSWIGMNAVILPGVVLGPHTVVGAGAVVTKSFPEGYCIVAGNPAKTIKVLEKN